MSTTTETKTVIGGLFWKFSEILCTDGISFIVSIVLARMLLPEQYGQIELVNVFITFANVFVINGLGTALIQKKNADNLDFSSVLYFNFLFSLVLYSLIYIGAPYIATFYNDGQLASIIRVVGLRIPIASVNSIQNAYISRHMMFKKMFLISAISNVSSGAIGIFLAYKGYGVWALVVQIMSCALIGTIVSAISIKWIPILEFSWQRLKGLIDYGWKILASSLIKVGYEQLSSLIIGKKYTSKDLAYYSRGKRYTTLVVNGVNTSINSVLFPALSMQQDSPEKIKSMTRRSIKISTYILTPILLGFSALAEPMVEFMLTDKWLPAVKYLRIACIYDVFQPVLMANLQAIRAIGKSDIVLKLDIIKRGIGVLLLVLLMSYGPIGVALAPVGMAIIALIINIKPNIKLINYSYKEQFMDLLPSLGLSITMAIIVYCFSMMFKQYLGNVLVMVFGFIIGVVVYVVGSIITRNENFQYVWEIIKPFLTKKEGK